MQKDFNQIIDCNDNDRDDGQFNEEIEDSFERTPTNTNENLKARLPKTPKSLESGIVGLNIQLKMLEFMDPIN